MKATIIVRVERRDGTTLERFREVTTPWPARESKAEFQQRMLKAAAEAVRTVMR